MNETEYDSNESTVMQLRQRIARVVGRLEKEADDRVSKREIIERRWLEDLEQYHGKYPEKVALSLEKAKKSKLFINQTRPKTNACEARLSDMLFPTDDKNWGIEPTPVPELTLEAEQKVRQAAELKLQAAQNPENTALASQANLADQEAQLIQARLLEARKRARAMEAEIDDHLRECNYAAQARDVIHDACKLGTGILKGPVLGGRSRRTWSQQQDDAGNVYHVMVAGQDKRPAFWRVDPWSFFPDPDATCVDESESFYERHLVNKKGLRKLAREVGFDLDVVKKLLDSDPRSSTPTYLSDLRSITGAYDDTSTDKYHVWEYHGQLSAEDFADIASLFGRADLVEDAGIGEDVDPMTELNVVIWFCQGELLKFGLHYLDSGDPVYSVFNLEKDEASIFGFGIPYLMRDSQKSLNAAWRTMLDNAGLSSGPQIVANPDVIEPADGEWSLTARKIWLRKSGAPNLPAFEQYEVSMHQGELAGIVEMSKRNIDEETNISMIAQGEQGAHVTQTAHGMSMLMNATNVVFRRIVKNWDDDLTTPSIRRMYDFLMQFSQKQHIKGDYSVDARGSSVLLVKEMQSANLMAFLNMFSGHPILGRFLRDDGLPAMRSLAQTMMIPADELIKSDDEIAQEEAAAAEQMPQPQPEIMKLEADMNLKQMEIQSKLQIALIDRETEMMRLAAQHNMKLEELKAKLFDSDAKRKSEERKIETEAALTVMQGPTGGGYF